jgi:type VI secretion system protein ImpJ
MRNPPIHWSEGMFLRPQHFQSADRHWNELVDKSTRYTSSYAYGIYRISISPEAIANQQIEITNCEARMMDGTIVSFGSGQLDRLDLVNGLKGGQDLKSLLLENDRIRVYLGIPGLNLGRQNVVPGAADDVSRYVGFERQCDDESLGGDQQEVPFRDLNIKILLSTDELKGYEVLPICQLRSSTLGDGRVEIDKDYFPPCLSMDGWEDLGVHTFRAVYDLIGSRLEVLSTEIREHGISLSSQAHGDVEKFLLLSALNESCGVLSCMAFANDVQPIVAYTTLCQIIGRLSVFGDQLVIPDVPAYDHDDLARIFKWAYETIRNLIFSVKESAYDKRYFVGAGRGMHVSLDPKWFGEEWEWYIGVDYGPVQRDECLRLLGSRIYWKLGSADQVEQMFSNRAPGIRLIPVPQPPAVLPRRGNWLYFQISRDNDAWRHVQVTQTMAMRLQEEQISDLANLEGSRRIKIQADNEVFGLEFAVFAVRKRV